MSVLSSERTGLALDLIRAQDGEGIVAAILIEFPVRLEFFLGAVGAEFRFLWRHGLRLHRLGRIPLGHPLFNPDIHLGFHPAGDFSDTNGFGEAIVLYQVRKAIRTHAQILE
jgi:hypothetical protein